MSKLAKYQSYADGCADELGIEHPVLRWSGGLCTCGKSNAHCHITTGVEPRGTICINRTWSSRVTAKGWHYTIAHEVAHLAVKSGHRSPAFARRMITLGVANHREQNMAKQGRRHRHIYTTHYWENGNYLYSTCYICHKRHAFSP